MPTLNRSPPVSAALPDDAESLPSLADGEWDADVLLDVLDDVLGVCQPDESVPKPSKGPSPRPKSKRTGPKKRNYDPNKARSEQLREVRRLRVEVRDLELKVQQLQSPNGSRDPFPTHSQEKEQALPKVWEAICTRQLARRLKAEQENCRLKKRQRADMKVVRRVEKVLFKRVMGLETERSKRIRRVEIPAGFIKQVADRIFDELSKGVELSYREVESVLETNCPVPLDVETHQPLRKEGMSIELFDSRVMPFDVQVTGDAWWRRWQNYRGQHSHEDLGHVIRERCGLEMVDVMTDKAATFYVQQILHRQVEDHRVAIVWNSYFEPFTFGETRVHGLTFLLKGYVLMKRVGNGSTSDAGDAATRVSTCYSITPQFLDPKLRIDPKTTALIKFFVNATSANISSSNEMMENLMVDQTLQRCS